MRLIFRNIFLYILCLAILFGCATTKKDSGYLETEMPEPEMKGIYHKVNNGETLWRIAKTYDVSINDIIRMNNIPNAAQIEKNQLLFIPGADSIKQVVVDTALNQNDFIWPVKGKVVKYFHQGHGLDINKGIDIKTEEGEGVKAARDGIVVFADYLSGYGNVVILDHADNYYSVYSHNSHITVNLGDKVIRGQTISHVGRNQNIALLHFEIRKNYIEDNPLYYLP